MSYFKNHREIIKKIKKERPNKQFVAERSPSSHKASYRCHSKQRRQIRKSTEKTKQVIKTHKFLHHVVRKM